MVYMWKEKEKSIKKNKKERRRGAQQFLIDTPPGGSKTQLQSHTEEKLD